MCTQILLARARPNCTHARPIRSAILQQHDETSDDDAASIAGAETTS
jgi:hypothetical protein